MHSTLVGPRSRARNLTTLAGLVLLAMPAAVLANGCTSDASAPAGEPVGEAQEHLTTCVTFQRGTFGTVTDTTVANNITYAGWGGTKTTLIVDSADEALLKFDVSAIPSNATVNSATLSLYTTTNYSGALLFARQALAPWTESASTFASFNQQAAREIMGSMTPSAANTTQTMTLKNAVVQGWVNGSQANNGIVLESMITQAYHWQLQSVFASSEAPTVSMRPALQVCYTTFNYCGSNPCQNGATCTDGVNSYSCACATGFTGSHCETNIDDCAGNPCQNGSVCVDGIASYTCACAPGFTGTYCETNIDDCAGSPCQNGGVCIDGVNSYSCSCAAGYAGQNCEIDVNDCAPNPCQNGGTCTDGVNSFTCACPTGFTGTTCQTAASCNPGLADCDGSPGNGCEVNLNSDTANCGACGNACPTGDLCAHGVCQAPSSGQGSQAPISVADTHGALAPAVADIDHDGNLDVLIANAESGSATTPSGSLSVRRGTGNGNLQAEEYYSGAPLSSNAVVVADVNGDGWADAITVNGQTNVGTVNGSISVYLNGGAGAPGVFGAPTTFSTGSVGSIHLCAADFDGDGKIDIATTSVTGNQVSVMFGDGTGGFGSPVLISIASTGGVQSTIGTADFNGDGRPDLVVTSPSSARISVLLNQGGGTFASPVTYSNSQNGLTAGLAFGDFDGDGKLDIISNGSAGRFLFFFKGHGDGTFSTGTANTVTGSAVANSALGVVAGDFNGDGKLDAYVLRTASTGGVYPMTGNGAGSFSVGTFVGSGSSPGQNALAVADMDGDGYLDLILTNRGSGTVTVILNSL